ncbi:hypothetical protein ACFX2C_022619 [Malus domestica]
MEQESRIPVSLYKYFLKDFFQQCTTAAYHMVEIEIQEPSKGKVIAIKKEKTPTSKESMALYFSIEKALRLSKEMQRALIVVLASPDDHEVQESKNEGLKLRPHEYATCYVVHDAINFTDEDLLLGSKPHNCPLFVSGYVKE